MTTKQCLRCKQDLPLESFNTVRSRPDGLDAYCRMCNSQRARARRESTPQLAASDVRRFMKCVKVSTDGCWEWQGGIFPNGYGHFTYYSDEYAHRFSYFIFNGELCEGLEICHTCNNRKCVNPAHLRQATKSENMKDAVLAGTLNTVKLNPAQVRKIRHLYNLKYSIEDLAQRFGVTPTTIDDIANRRTWEYV